MAFKNIFILILLIHSTTTVFNFIFKHSRQIRIIRRTLSFYNNYNHHLVLQSIEKHSSDYTRSDSKSDDSDNTPNDPESHKVAQMVELIVTSLNQGRDADLERAGMKVTRKSDQQSLEDKLYDPEVQRRVLGPDTPEEIDLMKRIREGATVTRMEVGTVCSSSGDFDETEITELREEAIQTLEALRQGLQDPRLIVQPVSSTLGEKSTDTSGFGSIPGSGLDYGSLWGTEPGVEKILVPVDTSKFPEFAPGAGDETPVVGLDEAAAEEEEEPLADFDGQGVFPLSPLFGSNGNGNGNNGHFELSIRSTSPPYSTPPTSAVQVTFGGTGSASEVPLDHSTDTSKITSTESSESLTVENALLGANGPQTLEGKFAALLRASMGVEQVRAETAEGEEAALRRAAVQALFSDAVAAGSEGSDVGLSTTLRSAASGGAGRLDMDALLGSTISQLARSLEVDVGDTLSEPSSAMQMRAIVSSGAAELAAELAEVDAQAAILNAQLTSLGAELRNETESFQQEKLAELDAFMQQQKVFENEVMRSKMRMQNSTENLRSLLQSLEDNADLLDALALFPLKSVDKKAAFVVGLALLLKVPVDAVRIVSSSLDQTDWFGVLVQAGVCLACLNHYGLIKAAFNGAAKQQKQPR